MKFNNYLNITLIFTKINFFLKYRRSYFGFFWGLANPMFMIASTAFIFSSLLHKNFFEYFLYVYAGMIPWLLISQTIFSSSNVYISNDALIRKVKINLTVFPIANLLVVLFDNLIACLLLLLLIGNINGFYLMQLIPAYCIITFFCIGCALFFSVLTVYFRDLQWLTQMGMQTLFFLTPILYKPDYLTGHAKLIVELNPITPLIKLFTSIFSMQEVGSHIWIISITVSLTIFFLGIFVYIFNQRKIIFRI